MTVIFCKQLRGLMCARRPWCLRLRLRRRAGAICKVAAMALLAMGLVNFAWMLLAAPEALIGGPDRGRRTFDGGIKLVFDNTDVMAATGGQGQKNCGNLSACLTKNQLNVDKRPQGNITSRDLNPIGRLYKDRITKEADSAVVVPASRATSYPLWCSGQSNKVLHPESPAGRSHNLTQPEYYLTAVLLVRIYNDDPAKLTTREMVQWLQYLSYAGVEHVYVYDAYFYKNESQKELLQCFIERGFVTYVDWSHRARPKYTIAGTQVAAYQHCLDRFGRQFAWQTAIDIDEYPYCPGDHAPGFLSRAVRGIIEGRARQNIGEISMQNYLYLGKPLNDSEHPLLIDRLWRRTIRRANTLVKPIYRPRGVRRANVHHNGLTAGYVNFSPGDRLLRMNHYWGGRLQNWGEDTPKVLNMTLEDRGMETAVAALKPCLVSECTLGCC